MKHYIIFTITMLSLYSDVFSQTINSITYPIEKNTPLKTIPTFDTNVVYYDMLDYALKVKISEVCTCGYLVTTQPIYVDNNSVIPATTQGVFLKMEVLEKIQDFSFDSVADSIIKGVNYLLVPLYLLERNKIPFNAPVNITVTRGINYKYLVFHYMVSDSPIFKKSDPHFAGNDGLEPPNNIPIYLFNLYTRNIISKKTLYKLIGKSKNSKNIEKCLKKIGISN